MAPRPVHGIVVGAGALLALSLAWWLGEGPESAPDDPLRPNVIVYLVDTLRADRLGVYGHDRDTSPRLDAFARDAVVFQTAYSPSSWTRPATASVLTGLSPVRHRTTGRGHSLPASADLLSERLQRTGYHTRAFVTNPNVIELWGFDQGFDAFVDLDSGSDEARADAVVDRVIAALDARPDAPFFFYVHTMDPHTPHDPPEPFRGRFASSDTDGPDLYDGEIAFGDVHFGRLVDRLEELGLYDDTLIVFTSDHGEEFYDHGGTFHGRTLFEEVVRVPLLIKLPDSAHAGRLVREPATLMDVAPTVLAAAGAPAPDGLDGVDRTPGAHTPEPAPIFFDLSLRSQKRSYVIRAVRDGSFKYIRQIRPLPTDLLFDLSADPGEARDLSREDAHVAQAARLALLLHDRVAEHRSGVHLRVRSVPGADPLRCRVAVETEGRFVDFRTNLLEPGDRITLDEAQRSIRVDVTLRNRPHPTGGYPKRIVDEDAVAFEIEPHDARVELAVLDGDAAEPCPLKVGAAQQRVERERLRFRSTEDWLQVRDIAALAHARTRPEDDPTPREPAIFLGAVRDPDAMDVPDEIRARLEQLGYLD